MNTSITHLNRDQLTTKSTMTNSRYSFTSGQPRRRAQTGRVSCKRNINTKSTVSTGLRVYNTPQRRTQAPSVERDKYPVRTRARAVPKVRVTSTQMSCWPIQEGGVPESRANRPSTASVLQRSTLHFTSRPKASDIAAQGIKGRRTPLTPRTRVKRSARIRAQNRDLVWDGNSTSLSP